MEIYYVNHKGTRIDFDKSPYLMLTDSNVFDYEWTYETKNNNLYNIQRSLPTKDISIVVTGKTEEEYKNNLLYLYETLDADGIKSTCGRLYFGDYYLSCFASKSEKPNKYINTRKTQVNINLVADNTTWVKSETTSYNWGNIPEAENGKGYPYDFAYDYKSGGGYVSTFNSDGFGDSDVIITISGYARYPEIVIGDVVYQINYTIQKDEICVINTKEKTVRLRRLDGTVINLFRYRSNIYYLFNKVSSGKQAVYWNGNYNFTVELLSERGEPKWI